MYQVYAVVNNSPPVQEHIEQRKIETKKKKTHITLIDEHEDDGPTHILLEKIFGKWDICNPFLFSKKLQNISIDLGIPKKRMFSVIAVLNKLTFDLSFSE